MRKTLLIVALLPFLLAFTVRLEDKTFAEQLSEKLLTYLGLHPVEKAYLHLDRSVYTAGDTIWFSAYLQNGFQHRPDSTSRVLYVELIDEQKKKLHDRFITRLSGGRGEGSLQVPNDVVSGNYTVRAYTNWMRNADESYYYKQRVAIVSAINEQFIRKDTDSTRFDLQFFPEGGDLVADLESKVGFKAVGLDGLGKDVEGMILNAISKDTLVRFSTLHKGMGFFQFTPKLSTSYVVMARSKQTAEWTQFDFVDVKSSGYVTTIDNLSNKQAVRIFVSAKGVDMTEGVSVVVHTRGMVSGALDLKPKSNRFSIQLPRADLPNGITTFTLFNKVGQPVAERIFFIDNQGRLRINVTTDKAIYKPYERVNLNVLVTDTTGKPVSTQVSLAATEKDLRTSDAYSIDSYLLLQSDLRGYLEEPFVYFDPKEKESKLKLDVLMLTQGWRRFTWKDVLEGAPTTPKWWAEPGITLSGQVLKLNAKDAGVVNLSVWMQAKDSSNAVIMAETDLEGRFRVMGIDVSDTLKVLVQARKQKGGRGLEVKVDSLQAAPIVQVPFSDFSLQGEYWKRLLNEAREFQYWLKNLRDTGSKLLNEVTVKQKREDPSASKKIYGMPDASLKMNDLMRSSAHSVLELLRGRIAGVNVMGTGASATVQIRGQGTPLFLLDGMMVEQEVALNVNVQDIESIDVLKGASAAIFGSRGGGGVIAINTRMGGEGSLAYDGPGLGNAYQRLLGYSVERKFYSPIYEVATPKPEYDFRHTLFWAPRVQTDNEGRATVTFHNPSNKSKVNVNVQGISEEGLPGVGEVTYEVK